MRRLALPALLLLALAALLAWLALRPEASGTSPGDGAEAETAAPPEPAEPAATERAHVARKRVEGADAEAGAAEEAPSDAPAAEPPAYVVRIVTEDDATPVRDVRVMDMTRAHSERSDDQGRVRFDPLEPEADGGAAPELRVRVYAPGMAERSIALGETVLRVPRPLPLDVRFVDAETRAELPAFSCWAGGGVLPDDAQGAAALRPLWPGEAYDFEIRIAECTGGTARPARSVLHREGALSRLATRVRLDVAIPRAARIVVHVADEKGAPVGDAAVQVWSAASRGPHELRTDAQGDARPAAFPHYRGERVSVTAWKGSLGTQTSSLLLAAADDEHVVRLVLDREETTVMGLGGSAGGRFVSRDGRRREQPTGTASLVVRVLLRDGRSPAGLAVGLHGPWRGGRVLDASGVARFDGLPEGRYTVSCADIALLVLREDIAIADGEGATLTLVEARGVPLELRVQDAAGHGLAGAEVTLRDASGNPWVVLGADGAQELALLTDAYGTLRLPEGPPRARVSAVYGSRRGAGDADDDGRALIVIGAE